jgi:hypothetical protein
MEIRHPFESVKHVLAAQIPMIRPIRNTSVHHAIVTLRRCHQSSVLGSIKDAIPVALGVFDPPIQHVAQDRDNGSLTISVASAEYRLPGKLRVVLPRTKGRILALRDCRH